MVVALDQATKWLAVTTLADGPVQIAGPLSLRLTYNFRGAFGLGAGFAPVLAVVATVVVVWIFRATPELAERWPTSLAGGAIVGGAMGNVADRVFRSGDGLFGGGVVDFIDLGWWPVFNGADIALTVGGALLLLAARHG